MRKIGKIFRFLLPVIALAALVVFMTGAGRRERATVEKNKATAMRYADEVWNKGDMAVADEILASNMIRHLDSVPEGAIRGRDALKQYIMACRTAWPDIHVTVTDVIAKGDKGMARGVWSGTFTGKVEGFPPPNGKEMVVGWMNMFRFAGGKIAEEWIFQEDLFMFSQMGMKLVPAGKQAGK